MGKHEKNNRLREVMEALTEQGIIRNKHQKKLIEGEYNKTTFASKLGTHTGVIPAILGNKRQLTEKIISNLCKYFDVSELFLRMGEGPMFNYDKPENSFTNKRDNILFAGIDAFAGDCTESGEIAPSEAFGIPGLEGQMFAFNVQGSSMEDILHDGDMVFCKKIEKRESFKEDQIYAIEVDGSVRIKYIRQLRDDDGHVVAFKLISENAVDHPPIYVDVHDKQIKIYRVLYYLTDLRQRLGLL